MCKRQIRPVSGTKKRWAKATKVCCVVIYDGCDVASTCIAPCFGSETLKQYIDPITHSPFLFLFLSLFLIVFLLLFFDVDIDIEPCCCYYS